MINYRTNKTIRAHFSWLVVAAVVATGSGCAGLPARNPLPLELTNQAVVPGVPEARFWGDEWPKFSLERFETFTEKDFQRDFAGIYNQPHSYLAVSGGGANGAFGAGLLVGWTQTGTRPEIGRAHV